MTNMRYWERSREYVQGSLPSLRIDFACRFLYYRGINFPLKYSTGAVKGGTSSGFWTVAYCTAS